MKAIETVKGERENLKGKEAKEKAMRKVGFASSYTGYN